jgi:hypothetical protein
MTTTVRVTGGGASVDGRPVEVPAGLDPVRCCLDRVRRDDGPVRALIVDERDAWEYPAWWVSPGRPDAEEGSTNKTPPPAVRVTARRWRVGHAGGLRLVGRSSPWARLAWRWTPRAPRAEAPSSSPGLGPLLQGRGRR